MKYLSFILFFSYIGFMGCQAVRIIGATPIEDHQKTVHEVQKFSTDISENQASISMVTYDLANENVTEAKANKDEPKLERAIEQREKAKANTTVANKLKDSKFTEPSDAPFKFDGLIDILLVGLGIAFPTLAGYLLKIKAQLGRVQSQAKIYASTPETFDVSNNKDLK